MSEPEKAGPSLWRAMNYGMRQCARYITVHDETGTSIFGPEPELLYKERVGYALAQTYALSKVPAPLTGDEDLTSYLSADGDKNITSYTHAGKQLTIANGVNMVCVDMGPGSSSAMHRTVSVDFVIVTEGEIELELDSGEKKILYSGDTVVQRATMHRWTNISKDKPARFIGVTISSDRIEVGGKVIEQVFLPK